MHALRTMAVGLAWGCLLGAGIARAGIETFDGIGLSNDWVEAGSFTGQQSIVWTYAHASGTPTVYTNNPSITLQTGYTTNKGWVWSGPITGGCSQISAAFKQVLSPTSDCVVLVNGIQIANYKSSGVLGSTQVVSFTAFDPTTRLPFTNDFTLMVSNRLATGGRLALDDLAWDPFRLFVRLDRTGTNTAQAGLEFDAEAQVFDVGQPVSGGWSIEPAFAGVPTDTNGLHLTLIPAEADVGQTFTVTYTATDTEGTGFVSRASFQMAVQEALSPRFLDFESLTFGYETNVGVTTNLNGMNWLFFNVRAGNTVDDRKIGTTSARFRHSSDARPASLESQDMFDGIGTVSLNYAYYGASNRTVTFELQVRADSETNWTTVPGGSFDVTGHDDITNSTFSVDVQQMGQRYVRLVTTGNFGEIANIDDLRIREFNDLLPQLEFSGETTAPLGRETVLNFNLKNAEAILRDWTYSMVPENSNAVFTLDDHGPLQLRFSPVNTNEWGDYTVNVSASITGAVVGATSVTVRVVSPPTFELAPVATNIAVPGIVDVSVTNVVLHGTNLTGWSTEWNVQPLFANGYSVSNKSRFRIAAGTTEADVGAHTVTAVLTDSGTGVKTTNFVMFTVTGSGGGDITNEVYPILDLNITNHLVVSGKVGRVFMAFGTTNLTLGAEEATWSWQGPPVTNTDGSNVILEITNTPDPRLFFYGVKVRAAP